MNRFFPIFFALLCSYTLFFPIVATAQEFDDSPFFDYNQKMRQAHQYALRMRIKDCKIALQLEKSQNPYNIIPHYIDDFADFMQVLANENHQEFLRMLPQRDIRLAKMRTGNKASPYYLYCLAATQLQWAWIHIKFDESANALKAIKLALPDLERNIKSYPDFVGNRTLLGIAQIMHEWVNPRGAQDQAAMGMVGLRDAINYGKQYPKFEFNEVAHFWYGLMLLQLNSEDDKDWRLLNQTLIDPTQSLSGAYIIASMHVQLCNTNQALAVLERAPTSDAFHKIHYLEYLRGLCHLSRFDAKADYFFKNFLTYYKGEHHHKTAIQKQAWSALLQQKPAQYTLRMMELLRRGNIVDEFDDYAEDEALRNAAPDLNLLRAKLAFMNGRFDVALQEIAKVGKLVTYDEAELQFYKARIEHKMKRYDRALAEYQKVIDNPKFKSNYVTAQAYLYIGNIWADRGDVSQARQFYSLCQKATPDAFKKKVQFIAQYQTSLTQGLSNSNYTKKGPTIGGVK
jgi:tetratricopeptide (TPR) repeat protein